MNQAQKPEALRLFTEAVGYSQILWFSSSQTNTLSTKSWPRFDSHGRDCCLYCWEIMLSPSASGASAGSGPWHVSALQPVGSLLHPRVIITYFKRQLGS